MLSGSFQSFGYCGTCGHLNLPGNTSQAAAGPQVVHNVLCALCFCTDSFHSIYPLPSQPPKINPYWDYAVEPPTPNPRLSTDAMTHETLINWAAKILKGIK